jgi:hypothetical protein
MIPFFVDPKTESPRELVSRPCLGSLTVLRRRGQNHLRCPPAGE